MQALLLLLLFHAARGTGPCIAPWWTASESEWCLPGAPTPEITTLVVVPPSAHTDSRGIVSVVLTCSLDFRFLADSVLQASEVSNLVAVVATSHLMDGTPESEEVLEQTWAIVRASRAKAQVVLIWYPFDFNASSPILPKTTTDGKPMSVRRFWDPVAQIRGSVGAPPRPTPQQYTPIK